MKLELTEREIKLMNKFFNKKDFSRKPCFVLEIEGKLNRLYGTDGWHIFAVEQINEFLTSLPEGRYLIESSYFKPNGKSPIVIDNIEFDNNNKFVYKNNVADFAPDNDNKLTYKINKVELAIEKLVENRANYLDWREFKLNKEFVKTDNIALNLNLLKFVLDCFSIYNKKMYHRILFDCIGQPDSSWRAYYIEQGDNDLEFFGDTKLWAIIMPMIRN